MQNKNLDKIVLNNV